MISDNTQNKDFNKKSVKSKFKIGMRFERFPDYENDLILVTITQVSKHHLYFGSNIKKHKSWLAKNKFKLVENIDKN
jgi:hypothetical protein